MAEVLFRQFAQEVGLPVEVRSAGVYAIPGAAASSESQGVVGAYNLSLAAHVARSVEDADIEAQDLVFTMTRRHRDLLVDRWPQLSGRVHVLKEYLAEEGEPDVVDPFGGSISDYESCARELEGLLRRLAYRLRGEVGGAMMRIAVGCDHAGLALKAAVLEVLSEEHCDVVDCGTWSGDSVDYPDYGEAVGRKVIEGEADLGVVICGTGIGISIAANKIAGVRAALCHDTFSARMSRAHNDANVLAMGARVIGPGLAQEIVRAFLDESFAGGRHAMRVDKLRTLENQP